MLCPDGGVGVEVAGPGSSVEVVVTFGLLDRGCDTAVEEAVDDLGVIGVGVSVKIIMENTFMHIDNITCLDAQYSNRSEQYLFSLKTNPNNRGKRL